ncbi:MAG: hypothetical protein IJI73_10495, partial [Kiritimatiellae bacterium]|nr:hypothetical protein [Kiritimatiellia bacterium]
LLVAVDRGKDVVEAQTGAVDGRASTVRSFEEKVKKAQAAEAASRESAERLRGLIARRGAAVARFNAVRQALGDRNDLWIDRWEGDRVTIRGWKDRVAAFVKDAADEPGREARTASEIVKDRLRANPAVDAESVKVVSATTFGKDGCVEQFVLELKFK